MNHLSWRIIIGIFVLGSSGSLAQPVSLPLGGNAWVINLDNEGLNISDKGVQNWTKVGTGFKAYVRVSRPGTIKVSMLTEGRASAVLGVSIFNEEKKVTLRDRSGLVLVGEWTVVDSGYIPIVVKGLSKESSNFPDISSLQLEGSAITENVAYTKNNEGNFFHWGRRGPSVHLAYQLPQDVKAEWFYNEIIVPEGNDVVGSYFMANGFGEGYFGIQVNSPNERRVLFSVWSPYQTDDPDKIPEEQKIKMLKKGEDVYTGEFGNEGSGGQSILKYDWRATVTQRFLLHVVPDGSAHTIYTAYFFDNLKNDWRLIASFRRPKLATYLTRPHSFLENFSPNMGDVERRVVFRNQWIRDTNGGWHELVKAKFTADNTARVGYRKDYAGGAHGQQFYLRNCGFFNDFVPFNTMLERAPSTQAPAINFDQLP